MRSSALTLALAMLASAIASAQPPPTAKPTGQATTTAATRQRFEPVTLPLQWIDSAPRTIAPVLSPPGLTPTIRDVECANDPYEQLRTDCRVDDDDGHVRDDNTDQRDISDPDHGRAMRSDQSAGHASAGDWRDTRYLR